MSTDRIVRQAVPTGSLYSTDDGEIFLAVNRTVYYEDAFRMKWKSKAAPHHMLSIDKEGHPRQGNRKTPCFLVAMAPNDPRPKEYIDAYRKKYEDEDLGDEPLKVQTSDGRLAELQGLSKERFLAERDFSFHDFSIVKCPTDPVVIADMEKREWRKHLDQMIKEKGLDAVMKRDTAADHPEDPMYSAMDEAFEAFDALAEADKENRAEHNAEVHSMKAKKLKDIHAGALFSLRDPEKCPPDLLPAVYLSIEQTEAFVEAWKKYQGWINADDLLSLDSDGILCSCDQDTICYLRAQEPYDQRPKQYWDAFEKRYKNVKQTIDSNLRRRHQIKSGQFFMDATDHRNPKGMYLAVDRNADTEFYFRSSNNCPCTFETVRHTSQVRSLLREDEMLCISSDGRMLTTHRESNVLPAEDKPDLRDQLVSIYSDSLKEYAKDAHVEPANLPLYFNQPQFFSPLTVPQSRLVAEIALKDVLPGTFVTQAAKPGGEVYLAIPRSKDNDKDFRTQYPQAGEPSETDAFSINMFGSLVRDNKNRLVKLAIVSDEETRKLAYLRAYRDKFGHVPYGLKAYANDANEVYRPPTRKDIPSGSFYSYFPDPLYPNLSQHVFMAIDRDKDTDKAFLDEWLAKAYDPKEVYLLRDDTLSITRDGTLVKGDPRARCIQLVRPPQDPRLKEYAYALLSKHPELRSVFADNKQITEKVVKRKDIPVGWFFSHNPTATRFLAVDSTPEYEKALDMELGVGKGHLPTFSEQGGLYWSGENEWVYPRGCDATLANKLIGDYAQKNPPAWRVRSLNHFNIVDHGNGCAEIKKSYKIAKAADQVLSFDDGLEAAHSAESLAQLLACPRHQVKSGQFFKHPLQDEVFLAIERNTDTEWYALQPPNTFAKERALAGHMFCLDSKGRFLNTGMDSPCIIQSFTPALVDLHHQLVTAFVLAMRGRAKEMNVNLLHQPVVPYKFGEERPDLKELSAKMTEALKERALKERQLDAVDRLYQDQRDYFKREEQKAKDETITRVQKQLATFTSDTRLETDLKGENKRKNVLTLAKGYLLNSSHNSKMASLSLVELDKHGWDNVSREEEQNIREAITELQAFLKKWNKKHKNVLKGG